MGDRAPGQITNSTEASRATTLGKTIARYSDTKAGFLDYINRIRVD